MFHLCKLVFGWTSIFSWLIYLTKSTKRKNSDFFQMFLVRCVLTLVRLRHVACLTRQILDENNFPHSSHLYFCWFLSSVVGDTEPVCDSFPLLWHIMCPLTDFFDVNILLQTSHLNSLFLRLEVCLVFECLSILCFFNPSMQYEVVTITKKSLVFQCGCLKGKLPLKKLKQHV